MIVIGSLAGGHWYYAHLAKDMIVPELGIAVIAILALGILLLIKKVEVKN